MDNRGSDYDARFAEIARQGQYIHGEADFVDRVVGGPPATVVDAGCGTGRVAIELARRGYCTYGIDVDEEMLGAAQSKAPDLHWTLANLATVDMHAIGLEPSTADIVLAAGNVMLFVGSGALGSVVSTLGRSLRPGGLLIAGFSLDMARPLGADLGPSSLNRFLDLATYDAACTAAGLVLSRRSGSWDGEPYSGGTYAVSVHRMPDADTKTDMNTRTTDDTNTDKEIRRP